MSNLAEEKTELADFFSVLSEEKSKAKKKLEERIENPATGISSLFSQLNDALSETTKVSEDLSEEKILTIDDQKKIEVFSNLVQSFDSEEEIPEEVEIKTEDPVPELIVEPLMDREPMEQSEDPPKEVVKTDSIIGEIVNTLDEMGGRTEVKEEIDQIAALRKDFDKFRTMIQRDIAKREMSGAGSGEVRFEFLDDVDRDSVKVDGKFLKYQSSTGKFVGADASGGGGDQNLFSTLSVSGQSDVVADSTTDTLTLVAGTKVTLTTDANADSITITASGSTDEEIQDVVGAMFTSNTETGITATYEDGDGTIDLVVGTLNQDTTGNAATATALETARTIGMTGDVVWTSASFDGSGNVTGTSTIQANSVDGTMIALGSDAAGDVMYYDGTNYIRLAKGSDDEVLTLASGVPSWAAAGGTSDETIQDVVGAMFTSNTETGITVSYEDGDGTIDLVVGTLNQDTTGNAATATALETARTIGGTSFDGTANIAVALSATATALANARTIHGVSFDGTANIDLTEVVQDTVGAMFSSNTETGITVSYEDGDGTIDLVVGTLNQDTTGNAATATALETARTIHGVSFDGTGNIDLTEVVQDTVGAMFSSNTETGITVSYEDGDGTIDLVVGTLNQDTTGSAATLTTGRTIGMTGDVVWTSASFDGSGNVTGTATIQANSVTLGTDTTGNYVATIAGTSNEIEVSGSGSETAGVTIGLPDNVTIGGNLTVTGNYTVNGTTTTIATTNTVLEDNLLELNTGASTNANDSGLLIERGSTGDNAIIMWDESADKFQVGTTTATASDTGNLAVTTGTLVANIEGNVTGDVTGNASTATTLETARTIHGVSFNGSANIDLTEEIQDTVGAMFGSNTETGITVTYEDGDGTIDLVVGTLNQDTTGTAALATSFTVSANNSTDETVYPVFVDGATGTQGAETDTGLTYNPSSGDLAIGGELAAATLDISGNVDVDGTLEADAYTVDGTTLAEYISDTVGAMVGSNTETGITVTYQDGDNTLDFVVGTLNQDTTGNADTSTLATNFTVSANNSTDETVYPIFVDGATGTQGAETDTGLSYNPSTGVLTTTSVTGNLTGNVTGNASGTAASLATARSIAMSGDVVWSVSFDGSGNVTAAGTIQSGAVETAMIAADAITAAKIADDVINSEHYVDGSIDTAHIADSQITSAKIADGTIVAGDIASNAVTTAKINADAVTGAKIADDSINSEHYVDGSIDTAHIADDQITEAKVANDAIGSAELKTLSTLLIKNSSGSTLKTVHGAGA